MNKTQSIENRTVCVERRAVATMPLDKEAFLAKKDWSDATLAEIKVAARLGNPFAIVSLCRHWVFHPGEVSPDKAFAECFDAVTAEVPESLNLIGCLYLYGYGTFVNERVGFTCISQAASLGDAKALYNLGLCFEKGIGVDQPDLGKAAQCMRLSAKAGFKPAEVGQARLLHMFGPEPEMREIADKALKGMGYVGSTSAKRNRTWCANRTKQEAAGLPVGNHPVPLEFRL